MKSRAVDDGAHAVRAMRRRCARVRWPTCEPDPPALVGRLRGVSLAALPQAVLLLALALLLLDAVDEPVPVELQLRLRRATGWVEVGHRALVGRALAVGRTVARKARGEEREVKRKVHRKKHQWRKQNIPCGFGCHLNVEVSSVLGDNLLDGIYCLGHLFDSGSLVHGLCQDNVQGGCDQFDL